jgi:hypothetical protein
MSASPNIPRWPKLAIAIGCVVVDGWCFSNTSPISAFLLIVAGMWAEDFRASGRGANG